MSVLDQERLEILARLPLILNSTLRITDVVSVVLRELRSVLRAEAATVFLIDSADPTQLRFWASQGGGADTLQDRVLPIDRGIAGWCIRTQESVIISNPSADPRFYGQIDSESGFVTNNLLCTPLTCRGNQKLGAVQVLNAQAGSFTDADLAFLEKIATHIALAIDNARLVQSLQVQNRRLETLERRKGEMMTVIVHEFRTPLTLINSAAEIIVSGQSSGESLQKMQTVLATGVHRLTRLVGELRNLSFVSASDGAMVQLESFSLKLTIDEIVSHFEPIAAARQITLRCSGSVESQIRSDPGLLTIVLHNLISNAIRFTDNGGRIELTIKESPEQVIVEISDTGIGIADEELPLIFDRFYAVASAMHHSSGDYTFRSGGLGLGLATSRAILRLLGSEVTVRSKLNEGSTFSFHLPFG
jgi:signal transduction histidine kinase